METVLKLLIDDKDTLSFVKNFFGTLEFDIENTSVVAIWQADS